MEIETVHQELIKAESVFLQKKLGEALQLANEAKENAQKEKSSLKVIQSKIFIGKILSTKGRFEGDSSCFSQSLELLQSIDFESVSNPEKINLSLVLSEVNQWTHDWDQARYFASIAMEESEKAQDNSRVIRSLLAQSEVFILKNQFSEAFDLANQALDNSGEIEDQILKAEVYNLLCKIHIKRQEYDQILSYSQEVLEIGKTSGDIEKEIIASSNLAVYYGSQLDYKTSIQYFYNSLEKSEMINFDRQTAQNLINIGTIYARLFNSKEALNKYKAVVEKYDQVLTETTKTILFNNIGKIYFGEKNFERSIDFFEKTLGLAVQIQYTEMVALALAHLSKINCELGLFEEASNYADRSNELLEDMGEINAKSINLLNFSKIAHHAGDFETSIRHLKGGIEISKKVKNEDVEIEGLRFLSKVYEEQKDFENALFFKKIFAEKQTQYLNEQRNRQILDAEIKFATKEKQQQIDALQTENQLQAMLLQKQEEVERANDQLTQANEELKQFAYVASHDLKEPLRMIGSYTKIINNKFAAEVDEKTQTYFHYVTDGVERMNNLLDGLLQYATVGRGAIELIPVNLNDTLVIVQSNLRLLIAETQTQIIADDLPTIQGINSLLSQLFQNLISNAIKFRPEDIIPEIRISSETRENDFLISVKDNGIGIKSEYKDRIFVIFQRLHARTEYEGTGIGLAICHKIIQRLGGKIWVESEIGEGATFFFTFPRK